MTRIVFQSDAMRRLLQLAERYARCSHTVLIQGESGTGKELLAEFIHSNSLRADRPFIRVNCAAFNEPLVDSALFGHEKGAFTGADARRVGCFEAAADGTLFLDEVGELPAPVQARLLRVLEEKEFHRVGSFEPIPSRARIVVATNRDLRAEVREERFREDLYFRLEALQLTVSPLRERPDDILPLATHFLDECLRADDTITNDVAAAAAFSPNAIRQLETHSWPGNARQLRNAILRAWFDSSGGTIHNIEDQSSATLPLPGIGLPDMLRLLSIRDVERLVIEDRLQRFDGNKAKAAESLSVSARTLRNKLAEYNAVERAA